MTRELRTISLGRSPVLAALWMALLVAPSATQGAAEKPGQRPAAPAAAQPSHAGAEPAHPVQGELRRGGTRSIAFEANAGDLVYGVLQTQIEGDFSAVIVEPSGTQVPQRPNALISYVAPEKGEYAFRLASQGGSGSYELRLDRARPLDAAAAATGELASPRLRIQSQRLDEGEADTSGFWSSLAAEGTPLIERLDDDFLVTFLWRGEPDTRSVHVSWPFFHIAPVFKLDRLGQSDIWFRSFRLAPGTRFSYQMLPDPPAVDGPPMVRALALASVAQNDPLNPGSAAGGAAPGRGASVVELPPTLSPSPWTTARPDVAKGKLSSFEFESGILNNSRRISVYTPPGYRPDCGPYRLLFLFDGSAYLSMIPVPTILDNLIAQNEIAPTVAVFIDSVSIEGRAAELYPNADFTRFVAAELMHRIRSEYAVTRDPEEVVIGGFSLGGLAATHIAWRHPETFGSVLSQSGAFWWSREAIEAGRGEPILSEGPLLDPRIESFELARMIAEAPKSPIRLYLEAGIYEGDLLTGNRFLRDVLTAKGNEHSYREFPGGHDGAFWRESFADGLLSLAREPRPFRCAAGTGPDAGRTSATLSISPGAGR